MTDNAPRPVMETIGVKVRYEWLAAIDDWADFIGKSRSEVMRDAIRLYFKQVKKELIAQGIIDEFGNYIKPKKRKRGR